MPFRYRIAAMILAVLVIMPGFFTGVSAESVIPSVSAKSAVLIDASDGRVIFEKNACPYAHGKHDEDNDGARVS